MTHKHLLKKNKKFYLNNNGNHLRDFTSVKDVIKICSKIINKNKLEIYSEIEFKIVKENDIISYCKCTNEEYDNCEFFVRGGINECLNYETVEIEAAKIESIIPNNNQTFDRELVKNLFPTSVLYSYCQALRYDSALKSSHVESVHSPDLKIRSINTHFSPGFAQGIGF